MIFRLLIIIFNILIVSNINAANWIQTNGPFGGSVYSIVKQDSLLFCGTMNHIYRSTDYGLNWTKCNLSNLTQVNELIASNHCTFAATDNGIFRSCDGGITWVLLFNGSFDSAISYGNKLFFSRAYSGTSPQNTYVTTDNGNTWSVVNDLSFYVFSFSKYSNTIFATRDTGRIYTSVDSGATWNLVNSGSISNKFVAGVVSTGNKLYASTYGEGVFVSGDTGSTWNPFNTGLPSTYLSSIFEFGGKLFLQTSFNGLYEMPISGGQWNQTGGLYNQYGTLLSSIDSVLVYSCGALYFSNDTANTWTSRSQGITETWVSCMIETPFGIFAGSQEAGVFKTLNGGTNWIPVNNGITSLRISSIVFDGSHLYAGASGNGMSGGGVFVSSDSGNTWVQSFGTETNNMYLYGNDVAISIANTVFITTNHGVSWTSLMNAPITGSIQTVANGSVLYAFNQNTICYSYDHGNTWSVSSCTADITNLVPYNSDVLITAVGHGISITHDSGATCQPYSPMFFINSIVSTNSHLFGSHYGVFHSTDDGVNWTDISNQTLNSAGHNMPTLLLSGSDLYLSVGWSGVWKATVSTLLEENEVTEDISTVFPNPSTGIFDLKFNELQKGQLDIYNSIGNLILGSNINEGEHSIDLSNHPKGIYFASIRSKEKVVRFKLMVQ